MALILAIEPDRRQASQLTAMVRGRLHAELVLADTAERALHALGDRVPDLVLTSALLSPKDDSALAERLRALDGQASYVQTLTIPVLATGSGRGGGRGAGILRAGAPRGEEPSRSGRGQAGDLTSNLTSGGNRKGSGSDSAGTQLRATVLPASAGRTRITLRAPSGS